MAESDVRRPTEMVEEERTDNKLKHLDCIHVMALYIMVYLTSIYDRAKENSGPMKSGIQIVESAIISVTKPVYWNFHEIPMKILKILDDEIESFYRILDVLTPSPLKDAVKKVTWAVRRVPEVTRELATEIQEGSLLRRVRNASNYVYVENEVMIKNVCVYYGHKVVDFVVWVWLLLNQVPGFSLVAGIIVHTMEYLCQKYNDSVAYAWNKDYPGSRYLPLIPIGQIRMAFEGGEMFSSSTTAS